MKDPDRVKRGRRNRQRGKEGEREVVRIFREAFEDEEILEKFEPRRVLTESRTGSFDIEFGIRGKNKRLPYSIQVKNVLSQFGSYLLKAWREARDWRDDYTPVGVVKLPASGNKGRRDTWLVAVEASHYAEILAYYLKHSLEDME